MKCFNCDYPLEMVKLDNDDLLCPMCNMRFALDHAEYTERELLKNGLITYSNPEISLQHYQYFKTKYDDVRYITYDLNEYIYKTNGVSKLRDIAMATLKRLDEKRDEIQNILDNLE